MDNVKNDFSLVLGAKRLKISDVAKATGISRSTLTSIYYQTNENISTKTLTKICDYLQIPLSELIEYEPKKEGD